MEANTLPSSLLIGTGEYTTGWTDRGGSQSDKGAGVVGLVFFDLRSRGKVAERICMAGTNGKKFPDIRKHLESKIKDVYSLDTTFECFPKGEVRNYEAYKDAIKTMNKGDLAVIFTPDDTHFAITKDCLNAGLHVLLTKPAVKTLEEHKELVEIAKKNNVLLQLEVHKRYDPLYRDARSRIQNLGEFNYFYAYMSQPTFQLEVFRAWAGKSSDISYYLNSHHIDFHVWSQRGRSKPTIVRAAGSTGVALSKGINTEDTITLTVTWESLTNKQHTGVAVYTSSWTDAIADVHSQQRFFYLGSEGHVNIDQAHRGYTSATNVRGEFKSQNPLFFRYTPDELGRYAGQSTYGHISFERFVDAVNDIRAGRQTPEDFDKILPTGNTTKQMTAILEAGRMSLDNNGANVILKYDENNEVTALALEGSEPPLNPEAVGGANQ